MDDGSADILSRAPHHGKFLVLLLGHVNCPDARPASEVENSRVCIVVADEGHAVQLILPGLEEQLVEDVHSIFLFLRIRPNV